MREGGNFGLLQQRKKRVQKQEERNKEERGAMDV